jgi:hypothetical protein
MKFHVAWFGKNLPENIYQNKKIIEDAGHTFVLIHDDTFVGTDKAATIEKDKLWLTLASETPDGAFLDHDVLLNGLTTILQNDKPYFSVINGNPHIGYFIVNGHPELFKDLLNEIKTRGIQYVYGYTNKLLRYKLNLVYAIPDADYEHTMVTHNKYNTQINALNRSVNAVIKAGNSKGLSSNNENTII